MMNLKSIFQSIIICGVSIFTILTPCFAEQRTYSYSGYLSSMFYADCLTYNSYGSCNSWDFEYPSNSSFFEGVNFFIGDTFSGRFTYDTEAILSGISSDGSQAIYLNAITDYSFSMGEYDIADNNIPKTTGSVSIVNNRGNYDSFFTSQSFSSPDWFSSIIVDLQDNTGLVYDNFSIPEILNMDDFSFTNFDMAFLRKADGDQLHLNGRLTELTVTAPVPEPSTLLLLIVGIGALGMLSWKRKACD